MHIWTPPPPFTSLFCRFHGPLHIPNFLLFIPFAFSISLPYPYFNYYFSLSSLLSPALLWAVTITSVMMFSLILYASSLYRYHLCFLCCRSRFFTFTYAFFYIFLFPFPPFHGINHRKTLIINLLLANCIQWTCVSYYITKTIHPICTAQIINRNCFR